MPPLIDRTAFASGVWANAPIVEHRFDPSIAVCLDEQWQSFNTVSTTGDWVSTAAVSGTSVISTTAPGNMVLDAGATTDNQGIQIQRIKSAFVPAAGKSIWAEFPVTLTATTPPVTRCQLFVGLAAIDTTVIASGAMGVDNHLGWNILNGELLVSKFAADKASVVARATGPTFVAATKIRLGFRYDGDADTVQQYVDGVATGDPVATANIAKVALYPTFVCQSDATDRPNLILHPFRIFQLI